VKKALLLVIIFSLVLAACENPFMAEILGRRDKKSGTDMAKEPEPEQGNPLVYWTVTFDSMGGEPVPESQSVADGERALRPANPSRGGFGFLNWYEDIEYSGSVYNFDTPVTADITLYAKWSETFFTVTFNSNGGSTIPSQDVGEGGTASEPEPVRDGYAFDGWYSDQTFGTPWDSSVPITASITLYAKWVSVFTVTFNSKGGSDILSQIVREYGKVIEPAAPTKTAAHQLYEGTPAAPTGFTFDGWYRDESLSSNGKWNFANDTVTMDIILYAKWLGPIDVSNYGGTTAQNDVERAIAYVNNNLTTDGYTLFVGENVNVGAQAFNANSNVRLTIQGIGGTRTIQYNGPVNAPLFNIGSTASLILGNNITLLGIVNSEHYLVNLNEGTFIMKNGSKITGHTTSQASTVYAGYSSTFIMEGGEISNNTSNYNGSSGGVYVGFNATFTVGGSAVVSGNKKSDGTPSNVYLSNGQYITLSNPQYGMNISVQTATADGIILQTGATSTIASYFHADEADKRVLLSDNRLVISDFYARVTAYATATADVIIDVPYNLTLPDIVTVPGNNSTLTIKSPSGGSNILTQGMPDSNGSGLFIVENGAKLVFQNITIDGNKDATNSNMPLVSVKTGGTFTLKNGAVLMNNRAMSGGGVYVDGGTFNMESGEIYMNTASTFHGGGGVYVNSGTFIMTGGSISFNNATVGDGNGGGVYVAGGTFTMSDGEIINNTATSSSGVFVNSIFNMNGGRVSDNTAGNNSGGVTVNGTFNMEGGEISGNTAESSSGGGGGVYVNSNGIFNMRGGKVSDNTAYNNGGGVYVYGSTFNMTGGEVLRNEATKNGGGVYVAGSGIFYIGTGKVYGTNDPADKNAAYDGAALYISGGLAQRGIFNNNSFTSSGTLNTIDTTIHVINGVSQ